MLLARALARDDEDVVGRDADADVLLGEAGGVHLEDEGLLGFLDVHLAQEGFGATRCLTTAPHPVELLLNVAEDRPHLHSIKC